ncbi:DUF4183 domain-containing protein (plasmid) [Alicyclobacillus fastidiosus]|uniref:DUF4183 domain-containing protein n=1 Tax=Alicyclobacillus fastidiosus TaxID=392011 RepID=A0ABY6ZQA6_9BACL|nr:DUF4183 domain-containing protein [Alicyclobacillus fastidiosus]WAH45016.1 DUF4183 domain-containing protein [Alicyclobacillus fastidiosus]
MSSFPSTYGYATLYVNGMIQQNGIFTVSPSAIVITGGAQLDTNDSITVELVIQI